MKIRRAYGEIFEPTGTLELFRKRRLWPRFWCVVHERALVKYTDLKFFHYHHDDTENVASVTFRFDSGDLIPTGKLKDRMNKFLASEATIEFRKRRDPVVNESNWKRIDGLPEARLLEKK